MSAGAVAVIIAALLVFRVIDIHKATKDAGTLNCVMRDGEVTVMQVDAGEICELTVPDTLDMREVAFTSSDTDVVLVDAAGYANALSAGKATVTAVCEGFSAECSFTVSEAPDIAAPDELTTAILANEDILKANKEKGSDNLYSLTVNRRTNTVTAYTYDEKGKYTVPVRAMIASCGTDGKNMTVTGDFALYFQEEWHPLYGDVYGLYVSGFEGPYLFHSVPYKKNTHDSLEAAEFNRLGEPASQGCVRMMVSDVYWIFKNCALNTPVHVIDADESADPLGKPASVKLPKDAKWDPTDPKKGNPYKDKLPLFEGTDDVSIPEGTDFDPMEGVSAVDICGNDITASAAYTGRVLTDKPGAYYLTYSVTDVFGRQVKVMRTVTVTAEE